MRKALIFIIISIVGANFCLLEIVESGQSDELLARAFDSLKSRQDDLSLSLFEQVLEKNPDNTSALCGKAEVLRRRRDFKEAKGLIDQALSRVDNHPACMNCLAYINYYQGRYSAARKIIGEVLNQIDLDRENKAISYVLLGTIHAAQAKGGNLLGKFFHGTQIKGYFQRAIELAPDLSEAHLGLGTFSLFAPGIMGGGLKQALDELKQAVELTPNFATANARLAQAYQRLGDEKKFKFYCARARQLDPENEVLKEITIGDE